MARARVGSMFSVRLTSFTAQLVPLVVCGARHAAPPSGSGADPLDNITEEIDARRVRANNPSLRGRARGPPMAGSLTIPDWCAGS